MKKRIFICVFLLLILFTMIFTVVSAINTYNYEIENVDILTGLGAVFDLMVGGFVVFYEFDLFHTFYYFLFRPKTTIKTLLNILANLCLITVFVYTLISNRNMALRKYEYIPVLLIVAYVIIRVVYSVVFIRQTNKIQMNACQDTSGNP